MCFLRFIPTFAPFSLFHSITSITTFILHYHDTIYVPDVRDFSNRAVELAESSQYDEVLDLVNNGIKPDTGNANAMRVNALAPQGKFPLATTSFVMIPVYEKG